LPNPPHGAGEILNGSAGHRVFQVPHDFLTIADFVHVPQRRAEDRSEIVFFLSQCDSGDDLIEIKVG
jgi:hypothetical protein